MRFVDTSQQTAAADREAALREKIRELTAQLATKDRQIYTLQRKLQNRKAAILKLKEMANGQRVNR